MKKVIQYKKTSLLRRGAAFLLDIIVVFLCFVFINAIATNPILKAFTDYDEVTAEYDQELLDTHLYYKDNNESVVLIVDEYDKNLTYFFNSIGEIDTYNKMKEDSGYFEYNIETSTWDKKSESLDSDVKSFYLNTLKIARDNYILNRDSIKEKQLILNGYGSIIFIVNSTAGFLIAFLLVPMLSKDGSTLGMKPFYLGVVSNADGGYATKMQVFMRFLIVFAIYFMASLYTFGLPLIASGIIMVFTDKKLSICDLLCSNYVIDMGPLEDKIPENEQILIVYDDGKEEERKCDVYD